ncbi:MAG: PilN domain-containing protein [Thiohalocapsa sp.]|jgi:type IV pilus assembly protein PilN
MVRINLLPWRDAERRRRQRELALAAGVAVALVMLIGIGIRFHIEGTIVRQQDRNALLRREIAVLDRRIAEIEGLQETKASLLARMNVIQQLQASRPEIVHLFDELVATLPEGVYITRLKQLGDRVEVEGRAQSNARVSAFMRNIEGSAWIGDPELLVIENQDQTSTGLSHFRLGFSQRHREDSA